MEIQCSSCGTRYNFDESSIPESGMMVKCASCGFVFKIKKQSVVVTEEVGKPLDLGSTASSRQQSVAQPINYTHQSYQQANQSGYNQQISDQGWYLRKPDGNIYRCKDLATLSQWITEKRVLPTDEISKTGQTWKRISDVPELNALFSNITSRSVTELTQEQLINQNSQEATQQAHQVVTPQETAFQQQDLSQTKTESTLGYEEVSYQDDLYDFSEYESGSKKGLFFFIFLIVLIAGILDGYFGYLKPKVKEIDSVLSEAKVLVEKGGVDNLKLSIEKVKSAKDIIDSLFISSHGRNLSELIKAMAYVRIGEWYSRLMVLNKEKFDKMSKAKKINTNLLERLKTTIEQEQIESAKNFDKAFKIASDFFKSKKDSTDARLALLDYYRAKGAQKDIIKFREGVSRKKASNRELFDLITILSDLYLGKKDAKDRARKLLDKQPIAELGYVVATLYFGEKNYREAKIFLHKALKANPAYTPAKELLDKIIKIKARKAAANQINVIRKEKKRVTSIDALLKRGNRLLQAGKSSAAVTYFEKVLEKDPSNAEAHLGMGWCYLDMQSFGASIAEFKKALENNPKTFEAYIGLGESYKLKWRLTKQDSDRKKAIKYYSEYLKKFPDGPSAVIAKNNIDDLK